MWGLDILVGTYNFLDLVPKGRDEDGTNVRAEHPGNDDLHALASVSGTPVPPLDR
jgi:predicted dithiol-disulfide oxidoreductase (DUF899 family)